LSRGSRFWSEDFVNYGAGEAVQEFVKGAANDH
jgi:hypothetical protein